MKIRFFFTALAIVLSSLSFGQTKTNVWAKTGVHNQGMAVGKLKSVKGVPPQDVWNTTLQKVKIYHGSPDSIDLIKATKLAQKSQAAKGLGIDNPASRTIAPEVSTSIEGTTMTNSTPPDNTVAISNAGRIVAVDNEDISYFDSNGSLLGASTHGSFFSGMTTSSQLFDPRVIYDATEDRFIYILLHGSSSSESKFFVCFSETNNPFADGWHIYEFSGNPLNDDSWTDYPHIGITDEEVFITGNLFSNSEAFNQVVIWQIDKSDGYAGAAVSWDYWDDVDDAFGSPGFSLVPASHGFGTNYGSNMYFVSNYAGGGNRIFLWEITDNLDGNAEMEVEWISSNYAIAADGSQAGSDSLVDVGDCRMQHAFYLNGNVHCVHASEYLNSAYSGIYYYRIPVNDPRSSTERTEFGQTGFDYAFPSIAPFGLNEEDLDVMVGALRTGGDIFPEMRVINCDENLNWSNSTLVHEGEGAIDFIGSPERWGDYSAMQRKHNAASPEVWFAGCYPTSNNIWRTRLAEITGEPDLIEPPMASFYSSDSTEAPDSFIDFFDNSEGNPDSWEWTFEGGTPATSQEQNETVHYASEGTFDVKLVVTKSGLKDSLVIEDMISIILTDGVSGGTDTDTVVIGGGLTVFVINGDTFELFGDELVPLAIEEPEMINGRVFPNPVSHMDMLYVEFELPVGNMIEVEIFDINGRLVKTLHRDYSKAGIHRIGFNKLALNNGQYLLRINSDKNLILNETIIVRR